MNAIPIIYISFAAYLILPSQDSTRFIFYRCVLLWGSTFKLMSDTWRKVLCWPTHRNFSGNCYIHPKWMAGSWRIWYGTIRASARYIGITGSSLPAVHMVWLRRWIQSSTAITPKWNITTPRHRRCDLTQNFVAYIRHPIITSFVCQYCKN